MTSGENLIWSIIALVRFTIFSTNSFPWFRVVSLTALVRPGRTFVLNIPIWFLTSLMSMGKILKYFPLHLMKILSYQFYSPVNWFPQAWGLHLGKHLIIFTPVKSRKWMTNFKSGNWMRIGSLDTVFLLPNFDPPQYSKCKEKLPC